MVGSLVLWPAGSVQVAGTVAWRDAELTLLGDGDSPDTPEYRRLRAVDTTSSCSLLVRTATFDAAGGLDDELYPAGWVDVTLCFAVRRLGQVVLVEPRSRVHHVRGGTLGKTSSYRTFTYGRQRSRFVKRFAAEVTALPDRPREDRQLREAMVAARACGRRLGPAGAAAPTVLAPAPPVTSPLVPGGDAEARLDAALRFLRRERDMRDAWGRELEDRAARADADNALVRADRDRAIEYARSLEVSRDEALRHAAALEAEVSRLAARRG